MYQQALQCILVTIDVGADTYLKADVDGYVIVKVDVDSNSDADFNSLMLVLKPILDADQAMACF
jgi:hypothetical protein